MIAKVEGVDRLQTILRNVPVRPEQDGWSCKGWVKEALEALQDDGKVLGTSVTAWKIVKDAAIKYCQKKKDQHRFDGKGNFETKWPPTFDLLEEKETIV